jgi:anti-anti-sigma factor
MVKKLLQFSSQPTKATVHDIVVYTLSGYLYGNVKSYELQENVRATIADGKNRIVVDLAAVEKIDSAGVGILASLMWSASQSGGGLVMVGVPPTVEKILGIAMLLDRIDHADTCDAAIVMLDKD